MNYFENITFQKGVITVLGIKIESEFVTALKNYLEKSGTVTLTTDKNCTSDMADYVVLAPDAPKDKEFIFHSKEDIELYSSKGFIIGYISVDLIEKEIAQVVNGAEAFAEVSKLYVTELMFPRALARGISENEKYDLLYIDDVYGEGKRYFARDITRYITYGAGVRMLNTDSDYVEELVKL